LKERLPGSSFGVKEIFDLRLLELNRAEDKLPGSDLIAEALADLPHAKRQLQARSVEQVVEVGKDALGRLAAQVDRQLLAFHHADAGLQHGVEQLGRKDLRCPRGF
jgi:hypothetical protein